MAIFPGIKELKESIIPHSHEELDIPDNYNSQPGDDHRFMAAALKLAEKGLYTTHPNPRVGCVIVLNGVVVGEGFHRMAGEAHAEINALKQAGKYAKGATMYVNLEPCCHHGRTPPCTDAIIKAGIHRVVIAIDDPNPKVNRAGISALQQAGISVDVGVISAAAHHLNRGFIRRITAARPWVTLKIAVSLDGKTAMQNGESQWITSEQARQDAHKLRASSSAIMTGVGTVLRDNPKMTARIEGVERQPLRVILDSRLSTPPDAAILSQPGEVLILTSEEAERDGELLARENVEIKHVAMHSGAIDTDQVLKELAEREINDLMLEAGSKLSGAMLRRQLVDELVVYMAPDLLGSDARGMFQVPGLEAIEDRQQAEFTDVRMIGRDLRLTLNLNR